MPSSGETGTSKGRYPQAESKTLGSPTKVSAADRFEGHGTTLGCSRLATVESERGLLNRRQSQLHLKSTDVSRESRSIALITSYLHSSTICLRHYYALVADARTAGMGISILPPTRNRSAPSIIARWILCLASAV